MDYTANNSEILFVQNTTEEISVNKCNDLTLTVLARQYSSFVFLICMKYLKDEEKSKGAALYIFKRLFNQIQKTDIEDIKAYLYQETKKHCISLEM